MKRVKDLYKEIDKAFKYQQIITKKKARQNNTVVMKFVDYEVDVIPQKQMERYIEMVTPEEHKKNVMLRKEVEDYILTGKDPFGISKKTNE